MNFIQYANVLAVYFEALHQIPEAERGNYPDLATLACKLGVALLLDREKRRSP